jgi:hypothetical protein
MNDDRMKIGRVVGVDRGDRIGVFLKVAGERVEPAWLKVYEIPKDIVARFQNADVILVPKGREEKNTDAAH